MPSEGGWQLVEPEPDIIMEREYLGVLEKDEQGEYVIAHDGQVVCFTESCFCLLVCCSFPPFTTSRQIVPCVIITSTLLQTKAMKEALDSNVPEKRKYVAKIINPLALSKRSDSKGSRLRPLSLPRLNVPPMKSYSTPSFLSPEFFYEG